MKLKVLSTVALASAMFLASCGGSQKAQLNPDEQEVIMPCFGSDFQDNSEFFRARSVGESLNQNIAMKKARENARATLAAAVKSTIKGVTDNYVKSSEFNNKEEALSRFEQNNRTVINQELKGIKTICEKLVKVQSSGKYKFYIAIELSGANLLKAYNETISKDESLKVDYNYEKFKNTFDAEMAKMEKSEE